MEKRWYGEGWKSPGMTGELRLVQQWSIPWEGGRRVAAGQALQPVVGRLQPFPASGQLQPTPHAGHSTVPQV